MLRRAAGSSGYAGGFIEHYLVPTIYPPALSHPVQLVTSNRTIDEWIPLSDDPILAQSALDRLAHNAYQVVMDGESFRKSRSVDHPLPCVDGVTERAW